VPNRPFDGRRIGLSANSVKFAGKPEAIPKDVAQEHYRRNNYWTTRPIGQRSVNLTFERTGARSEMVPSSRG
jgi:hypothetical protein